MKKFFHNLSIRKQILLQGLLIILSVFAVLTAVLIPIMHDNLMDQQKRIVKEIVSVAISIIEDKYELSRNGIISEEEAKEQALKEAGQHATVQVRRPDHVL